MARVIYKNIIVVCLAIFSNLSIYADSIIYNSYNNHGIVGLINMPTARFFDESVGGATFYYGNPDQKITITAAPYDWMEASFFYTNIQGKDYGSGFSQDYKDKGFNVKIRIKEEGKFPSIAIGANDFAGTGFYSSEYLVSSFGVNNIDFHFGLGWGAMNGSNSLKNPFTYINQSFAFRPNDLEDQGGQINPSQYFSDKSISPFMGIAYAHSKKLLFKYERDSTKDPGQIGFKNFKTRNNFSIDYNFNSNITFGLAFERGNYASFKFAYKKKAYDRKKTQLYNNSEYITETNNNLDAFIKNLNTNGIGVDKILENDNSLAIELTQFQHPSLEILNSIVASAAADSKIKKTVLKTYKIADLEVYSELNPEYEKNSKLLFNRTPQRTFITNNSIKLRPYLASREGFLKFALLAENDSEFIILDNLFFSSNLKASIWSNFDDLYVPAKDIYLYQVRSDVKDYLNNFNNGLIVGRAQFDFHITPKKNNHLMLTAGILEEMFSGVGIEHLYFDPLKNYAFGFELFNVTKRDYKMRFGHKDYNTDTGFLNLYYRNYNIIPFDAKLSYGRYLGGDTGFTLDLYRSFPNGSRFGFFTTFTDVSSKNFGEGSFDKGIYFNFPFGGSALSYMWRPLTKDPGAKLNRKHSLHDLLVKFKPIN
jgi:hypothetical protein